MKKLWIDKHKENLSLSFRRWEGLKFSAANRARRVRQQFPFGKRFLLSFPGHGHLIGARRKQLQSAALIEIAGLCKKRTFEPNYPQFCFAGHFPFEKFVDVAHKLMRKLATCNLLDVFLLSPHVSVSIISSFELNEFNYTSYMAES